MNNNESRSRVGGEALPDLECLLCGLPMSIPTELEPTEICNECAQAFYDAHKAREQASDPTPALTDEQISALYLFLFHRKGEEFGWMEPALKGAEAVLEPLHSAIHDRDFDAMNRQFFGDDRFAASPQAGASDPTPDLREALAEALPYLMAAVFHPSISQSGRAGRTLDKALAALAPPQAARAPLSISSPDPDVHPEGLIQGPSSTASSSNTDASRLPKGER